MAATAESRAPRSFAAGDGLRAVAALGVFVFHAAFFVAFVHRAGIIGEFGDGLGRILGNLDAGVYIFFALSGYLLTRPFARAAVLREKAPRWKDYARRRVLRIVPAFWVAVTITLLVRGLGGSSPGELTAVFGFAQVYAPSPAAGYIVQAWTLDVEAVFYVLVPIIGVGALVATRNLSSPARRSIVLVSATAAVAAASLLVRFQWGNPQWKTTPLEIFFAFCPGIALAFAEPVLSPWVARWSRARALEGLLVAGTIAGFGALIFVSPRSLALRTAVAAAASGAFISAALVTEWRRSGRAWRVLDNGFLRWVGTRSYSLYLLHFLVLEELSVVSRNVISSGTALVLLLLIGLPLTLAAAAASYHFVERPFLRIR